MPMLGIAKRWQQATTNIVDLVIYIITNALFPTKRRVGIHGYEFSVLYDFKVSKHTFTFSCNQVFFLLDACINKTYTALSKTTYSL